MVFLAIKGFPGTTCLDHFVKPIQQSKSNKSHSSNHERNKTSPPITLLKIRVVCGNMLLTSLSSFSIATLSPPAFRATESTSVLERSLKLNSRNKLEKWMMHLIVVIECEMGFVYRDRVVSTVSMKREDLFMEE